MDETLFESFAAIGYDYREGGECVCAATVFVTLFLLSAASQPSYEWGGVGLVLSIVFMAGLIHTVGMRTFFINAIPAAVATPLLLLAIMGIGFASEMRDMGSFVAAVSCSLAMPTVPFFVLHYILSRWVLPAKPAAK